MLAATWHSGPHLLRVEEYVSKALQAGHTDLGAGVLEALGKYRQCSLFRNHLQQSRAIEELGAPENKWFRLGTLSWAACVFVVGLGEDG